VYTVLAMQEDGTLVKTNIRTNSATKGWATRIRDRVADLVDRLNYVPVIEGTVTLTVTVLEATKE